MLITFEILEAQYAPWFHSKREKAAINLQSLGRKCSRQKHRQGTAVPGKCGKGVENGRAQSPSRHPLKLHNEWNAGKGKGSLAGHGTKPPPKSLTKAKHIYSAVAKKDTGGSGKVKKKRGNEGAWGAMCKNPKICVGLCSVF